MVSKTAGNLWFKTVVLRISFTSVVPILVRANKGTDFLKIKIINSDRNSASHSKSSFGIAVVINLKSHHCPLDK